MTPIGHVGIALPITYALRLSLPVAFLGSLLPDLIDKPLEALGIGGGRYIGHTLLFVFVVAGVFFLWRRTYGLSVLLGMVSHLLLDKGNLVPWFYPFVGYKVPTWNFHPSHFFSNLFDLLHNNVSLSPVIKDLIWVFLAIVAAFLLRWLYPRFKKRRGKGDVTDCQTDGDC